MSLTIVACALALFGCGKRGTEGDGDHASAADDAGPLPPAECVRDHPVTSALLRIGVVPMGSTHEFWKAIHAGVRKAELELDGVQVTWKAPIKENDREQQVNVVESFINMGVDGIVLVPADDEALLRPVRDAGRAGIGVVIMDNMLNGRPCEDYASFIATDSYSGGRKAGQRLGTILNGQGNVLMLRCQIGIVGTTRREQGFLDAMAESFPGIRLVSTDQYGGTGADQAQQKAESLLQRFAELDGIFCPNESTTFGMLRALQQSGRAGAVRFVGFDSSAKLIEALAGGELHGLVLQDPVNIGYTAVRTMAAYLRGERVASQIDTGSEVATPQNMDEPRIRQLLSPPIERYLR